MTKRYAVHNLHCAGCAARIEDAIAMAGQSIKLINTIQIEDDEDDE